LRHGQVRSAIQHRIPPKFRTFSAFKPRWRQFQPPAGLSKCEKRPVPAIDYNVAVVASFLDRLKPLI
jgi:hypothetical protein